jgi:hypothetical protein
MLKNWKNASKAWITPAVRLRSWAGTTQLIASAGRMKISRTRPIAVNIERGYSLAGSLSEETCTAFISMPEYDRKLLMISTRLASPVHCGRMWLAFIGAAEGLPWPRKMKPRPTITTPGTSVPTTSPALDSPATALVPREETKTPVQNSTMMTSATYRPFAASDGSMM